MRELKELYGILLESLEKGDKEGWINNGVCGELDDLAGNRIITRTESIAVSGHFKTCHPSLNPLYKKFKRSKFYVNDMWWFVRMKRFKGGRNVRIRLVKEIIKNIE